MSTNDFQTFATGAGSNVLSPTAWNTTTSRQTGFHGIASSSEANTALRQASSITTTIAQFIADTLAQNVVDNGNIATLEAQFISAIQLSVGSEPQAALWHFGHDTGAVNVMQVTASPIITAYSDGMTLSTFPQFANTVTNPTLSANGLANIPIVHADGSALNLGDIAINTAIVFEYDATLSKWRIISQAVVPQTALNHFGADVGTANAMSVSTVVPGIATVATGMQFTIRKGAAGITGPTTLFIAGTSAALTWGDGTPFSGGEWPAGADGSVVYDGNYRLLGTTSPFAFIIPGTKPPLLASRTYYVDIGAGSDSNNGLSAGAGHAFATPSHALAVSQTFNLNGFNIIINIADGTYAPFVLPPINGSGNISIIGNTATPSGVLVSAGSGEAILAQGGGYTLAGMKVNSLGNGSLPHLGIGVRNSSSSTLYMYNMEFGACATAQYSSEGSSATTFLGNQFGFSSNFINISGTAPIHGFANSSGFIDLGTINLNISGSPNFTAGFINSQNLSNVILAYQSITGAGSVTGIKFAVSFNSVINTGGAGINYFPGNIAGVTPFGGVYN